MPQGTSLFYKEAFAKTIRNITYKQEQFNYVLNLLLESYEVEKVIEAVNKAANSSFEERLEKLASTQIESLLKLNKKLRTSMGELKSELNDLEYLSRMFDNRIMHLQSKHKESK